MIPLCLGILGIGRQGDGLHDLSKSLGTTVPLLFCGLPYPFQRCGSGPDVSQVGRSFWSATRSVPQEAVSKFYCVLNPLQKLKEMKVGKEARLERAGDQEISWYSFANAISPVHVVQLCAPHHSSSCIPLPSFPQRHFLALEHSASL